MPATMSIRGLYIINESLFTEMELPDGMTANDRDIITDNIVNEYAEFEILYPDPVFMQDAIGKWSRKEKPTWQRIYNAAKAEYNPIENYNRTERTVETGNSSHNEQTSGNETQSDDEKIEHTGTDSSNTQSNTRTTGTDTETNSGTDTVTHNKAAFDTNALVQQSTDSTQHGHVLTTAHNTNVAELGTASVTHGETVDTSHDMTASRSGNTSGSGTNELVREGNISGNIGVTTSQQMLEQELIVSAKLNVYNYIMESFKKRFCLEVF